MNHKYVLIGGGKGAEVIQAHLESVKDYHINQGVVESATQLDTYFVVDDQIPRVSFPFLGLIATLNTVDSSHICFVTSSNMEFRRRVYNNYKIKFCFTNFVLGNYSMGPLLANDKLGSNNFIFEHVSVHSLAKIGNNNVISTGCVINHHNVIGDGNLFGPGCMLSGSVEVGSNCTFGSGVIIEPRVKIGDNVTVPSGTVIVNDLPDDTRIVAKLDINYKVYRGERIARIRRELGGE